VLSVRLLIVRIGLVSETRYAKSPTTTTPSRWKVRRGRMYAGPQYRCQYLLTRCCIVIFCRDDDWRDRSRDFSLLTWYTHLKYGARAAARATNWKSEAGSFALESWARYEYTYKLALKTHSLVSVLLGCLLSTKTGIEASFQCGGSGRCSSHRRMRAVIHDLTNHEGGQDEYTVSCQYLFMQDCKLRPGTFQASSTSKDGW
jgi:hypothetical protein